MKRRRFIYEAPVGDYLSDEFKSQARSAGMTQDRNERMQKISAMSQMMQNLPSIESGNVNQLEDLAIEAIFRIYPLLKKMVDAGKVKIDAKITQNPGGRRTEQSFSPTELRNIKVKHPNYDALEKKRHFQNAQTQARAWIDGFNYVTNFMDEELDQIDPQLYNAYRTFTRGISDYYWENAEFLERMASYGAGRLAYCDVLPQPDGTVKIEARAPHFPLLMHELVKGAEYYKSMFSLPKNAELRKAIVKSADTHKHEIQNMNLGRELVNRLRTIFSSVKGYSPNMETIISTQMDELGEDEYNKYMDAVADNNQEVINELKSFVKKIVDRLK
jgi:hypothetical protein